MADYGKVFRRVWSNPKFRRGSEDARTLTLYLLTNEHGTSEGLYRLPAAYAAADLQWDAQRYEAAFAEVELQGFIERDADLDMVLIVNALEFNRPTTENHIKGAANVLAEVRDSPLRQRFMQQCAIHCPALLDALISQNGWTTDAIRMESEGHPNAMAMESECHGDAIRMESEGSPHSPPPPPPPLTTPTEQFSNNKSGRSETAHESGNDEPTNAELVEELATGPNQRQPLLDAISAARRAGHTPATIRSTAQRAKRTTAARAQAIQTLAAERPNVAARAGGVERVLGALPERASPPPANIRTALTSSKGDAA